MATPSTVDIAALSSQLYEACLPMYLEEPKHVFHQTELQELEELSIGNDIQVLLQVVQRLLDEKLFKVVHDLEGMGWKLRAREEAKKYRALSAEQELVYALIDESGQEGLWSKTIKARTNLHDAVFSSCIKFLINKSYICEMKSVEHPARKMYIKASLRPSERATGGPWFTDGELDDEFIQMGLNVLYKHIHDRSWYASKSQAAARQPKKTVNGMKPEDAKALRKKELEERGHRLVEYVPMHADYIGYMTLQDLTLKVENSSIFNQTLTASDVQQLLDVLLYDNRVERVMCGTEWGYRTLKRTMLREEEMGGVLTEIPCGRCPVFELCEEGGPVGPSECVYLDEWLSL